MTDPPSKTPISLLAKHPWLVFVLPFLVYMALGQFEPRPPAEKTPDAAAAEKDTDSAGGFAKTYPLAYTLKIILTAAAVAFVFPVYRAFPFWVHKWAIPVGLLGGIFWIAVCRLQLEPKLFELFHLTAIMEKLGFGASRPMFNPYDSFPEGSWMLWLFLGVRMVGLVLIVPVIEEFFLRGFVIRFASHTDWVKLPIGKITGAGIGVMLLYAIGTHPQELIAATVWFSMVTLFVVHSGNIWDAIIIHAVTNLTLGVYILVWQDWTMW